MKDLKPEPINVDKARVNRITYQPGTEDGMIQQALLVDYSTGYMDKNKFVPIFNKRKVLDNKNAIAEFITSSGEIYDLNGLLQLAEAMMIDENVKSPD